MSISLNKPRIYLDNAAATPIDPKVKKEITETLELYGNPSSFNDLGRVARKKLEESRLVVARFLGARPEEIIFTSSGSEANNMAILGLASLYSKGEIITTSIEHPSVLESLKLLQGKGWKITYLNVNKEGVVDLKDLEHKLNPKVVLVSVIYANNEIGTIQPVKQISKIISNFRKNIKPFFHVDACQATQYLDMNVNNLGVDLITFNGSKIYGPRGVGVLYKKRGAELTKWIKGGDQENGLRAGTENLPSIAGLAKAVTLIDKKEGAKLSKLRDYFFGQVKEIIPDVKINGPLGNGRLPNNISISIPGIKDEQLLLELDKYGIYASSGSACTSRSVEPSHVLKAIGVDHRHIHSALRLSLGKKTTKKDIDYVLKVLPGVIKKLRKIN